MFFDSQKYLIAEIAFNTAFLMLLSIHLKILIDFIELLDNNSEIVIRSSSKLIIHKGKFNKKHLKLQYELMKTNNLQMKIRHF